MTDPIALDELAEIVRSSIQAPPEAEIGPQTRFVDDLGADSFDLVCIVFAVQDRYGLKFEERDLPAITSLADLAAYVAERRGPRSSAA